MKYVYVPPFLFSRLAAFGVGDIGTSSAFDQARSGEALSAPARLRQRERHLHENQLRELRPRSCVGGFANKFDDRRHDATLQRRFISLGERAESGHGQVRLGTRVWSILSFGIWGFRGMRLHRESGSTSPKARFCRGTEIVCRALWAGVAKGQGMKPLKRFQFRSRAYTPLKRGVNDIFRSRPRSVLRGYVTS